MGLGRCFLAQICVSFSHVQTPSRCGFAMRCSCLASVLLCMSVAPLAAQDRSVSEMTDILKAQADILQDLGPNLGQTRGVGLPRGLEYISEVEPLAAENPEPAEDPATYLRFNDNTTLDVRVTFEFDSAALTADQMPQLERLCQAMKDSGVGKFHIYGHTDATGTAAYNEQLSLLRAEEVRRYFVETCGLEAGMFDAMGLGEQFLSDESNPDAASNRRVEFQAATS